MKIEKYKLWLAFFFFIFGMTFSMIIWTVKSAVDTPVYEDKSFLSSYQDVDENYNQMMEANHKFNQRYETQVRINDKTMGMEVSDLRYGQRSLKKMSNNQNMLHVGDNEITLSIMDRETHQPVTDAKIAFQVTRAIEDMYDINLNDFKIENHSYRATAPIKKAGNWNIMGKVMVGEDTGYLYIKTNTKDKHE